MLLFCLEHPGYHPSITGSTVLGWYDFGMGGWGLLENTPVNIQQSMHHSMQNLFSIISRFWEHRAHT